MGWGNAFANHLVVCALRLDDSLHVAARAWGNNNNIKTRNENGDFRVCVSEFRRRTANCEREEIIHTHTHMNTNSHSRLDRASSSVLCAGIDAWG